MNTNTTIKGEMQCPRPKIPFSFDILPPGNNGCNVLHFARNDFEIY